MYSRSPTCPGLTTGRVDDRGSITTGGWKLAVVTNSTYDGLCYNAELIKQTLGDSVEVLHFDEAWYAYAAFH